VAIRQATRAGAASDADPRGLSFRAATEADLPACARIHREGIDHYLRPMGFPPLPPENPGLRRLHAHTLATDPSRFVVAERRSRLGRRSIVGFGSAVEREHVWFLSMLFVDPAEQGRGLGRGLLARMLPAERDGQVLATCTDAAQPISNGLYASLGLVPRMPLFNLLGRPRTGWLPPAMPAGLTALRVAPENDDRLGETQLAELAALDRALLGYEHPADHAFDLQERPWLFAYRTASGELAGYGYTSEVGRVGPIAVREPELLGPVLGHLLTTVQPRGASAVWLPGEAEGAFRTALAAGLRIEGFPTIACWNRPFADFTSYVPTSPGLI
jgi:GNAT superfamily N-acetyltransferase